MCGFYIRVGKVQQPAPRHSSGRREIQSVTFEYEVHVGAQLEPFARCQGKKSGRGWEGGQEAEKAKGLQKMGNTD